MRIVRTTNSNSRPRPVLQSVLHHAGHLLWCEVATRGERQFEIYVVPQWDMASAVVETFTTLADAVRRHAELCWLFREDGWRNVPRVTPSTHAAA